MEGYNFSPEKLTSGKLKTFENFTLRAETLHTRAYTQHSQGGGGRKSTFYGIIELVGGPDLVEVRISIEKRHSLEWMKAEKCPPEGG